MSPFTDILMVEDDPGDARLALAVFRTLKIADKCAVVSDGEQALEFLQAQGRFAQRPPGLPRLILLDLKMPRMDGFEFLQRIKADEQFRLIPVVALTSSREERDVERAYDLNVNAYVVKSIDFTEHRTTLEVLARYWYNVNERPPGFLERKALAGSGGAARSGLSSRPSMEWFPRPSMGWFWAPCWPPSSECFC